MGKSAGETSSTSKSISDSLSHVFDLAIIDLVLCRYEKKIQEYNFGSLIRTDAKQEYTETNTIFGEHLTV
jgi:hypothetical protein